MYVAVMTSEFYSKTGRIIGRHYTLENARKGAYSELIRDFNPSNYVEIYDSKKSVGGSVGELVGAVKCKPIFGHITWHPVSGGRWVLYKNGKLGERQL